MKYDITRPWLTLDSWQKEYVFDPNPVQNNFLLCGRQTGKTTAMSMRAVELCVKHYKKGEFILINSITEKQAYHMLAKALVYARAIYPKEVIWKGDDKPTKHKLMFKKGTGVLCYAAGETGEGLRGFTIKKLMPDEGSRMSEEYFIAVEPQLSVIDGSMDISSTPAGKKHKDGSLKYFYKCSLDKKFKKYYVSAEDCPRHSKEFLEEQKKKMSKLAYAQEYLAEFLEEVRRLFDDDLIDAVCVLKRSDHVKINPNSRYYLGVDVAGLGKDECAYEIIERKPNGELLQVESISEKRNLTTDTTKKIIQLNQIYNFRKIGIDDGGVGFGVWSELMVDRRTKYKTIALNNASRPTDNEGKRSKKILKEEMYMNLQVLMENKKIKLLDDDEVKASLSSIQHDEGKIFGSDAHHSEGIDRGAWIAEKNKGLRMFCSSF